MSKMQTVWTETAMIPIRNKINTLVQNGMAKTKAYEQLGDEHGVSSTYMARLCNVGPDKLRQNARKYKRSSVRGNSAPATVTRHVSTNITGGHTMTAQEAVEFYMFVKRNGITIA